jgi:ABC-type transport system involved in multi-copper enzyme maturation permease subunit
MTSSTMPVQPGRAAGPAGRETELWRGMLWVTWRQHRGVLISVPATFTVAVTVMLIAGLKIHHDYATLMACHPANSVVCLNLTNSFYADWHLGNGIRVALLAAPVLLAMFAGPPVVARELENRTFRYAWTQGIGRMRWTVAKLTYLGSVITIAALIVSQLFTWLFAPFLTTQDLTVLSPAVFETRGIAYAVWTLTAFCLGAFLGTLIRRVIPAMAASLGAYLALTGLTWAYLQNHYPVSTFWPRQAFEAGWLLAVCALLVAATRWLVRRHAA